MDVAVSAAVYRPLSKSNALSKRTSVIPPKRLCFTKVCVTHCVCVCVFNVFKLWIVGKLWYGVGIFRFHWLIEKYIMVGELDQSELRSQQRLQPKLTRFPRKWKKVWLLTSLGLRTHMLANAFSTPGSLEMMLLVKHGTWFSAQKVSHTLFRIPDHWVRIHV